MLLLLKVKVKLFFFFCLLLLLTGQDSATYRIKTHTIGLCEEYMCTQGKKNHLWSCNKACGNTCAFYIMHEAAYDLQLTEGVVGRCTTRFSQLEKELQFQLLTPARSSVSKCVRTLKSNNIQVVGGQKGRENTHTLLEGSGYFHLMLLFSSR